MKLLLLLVFVAAAQAATMERKCRVSEWGDWQVKHPRDDRSGRSFATTEETFGTTEREKMFQMKDEISAERQKCKAEGTCPEQMQRKSEGAIPCVNGFIDSTETADLPCENINQLSFMNFEDLLSVSSASGNDIWGWTDPSNNNEYAIMMMTTGTSFVDVTDPSNPVAVAFMDGEGNPSTWRDGKVVNDYAFIVSEASGHGIQAFDLTRLRTINPGSNVNPDYVIGEVGNCHNIVANPAKNKIYGVGCTAGSHCANNGGLFIVDVTDPANPVLPGINDNCYDGDGYVHDAQCMVYNGPDAEYVGKDICFCYNEDTFTIVDTEDNTNIQLLSRTSYAGAEYTHQGWATEDHTLVLLDDELDEQNGAGDGELRTYMWDIQDLTNPVLMNTYWHGVQSIDHNQYVLGDYTYQADYATGLRIYEINQASYTLTLAGKFDVFPGGDAAIFEGSWSVYPYFPSGNIIISSINYGLYVVEFVPGAEPKVSMERTRYRDVLSYGDGNCPVLSETESI